MSLKLTKRGFSTSLKSLQKSPNVYLRSGQAMPMVALGTWKSQPDVTTNAVVSAIKSGYTNIDCANDYNNETAVGDAFEKVFKEGIVERKDLFIQAKLWNSNHRPEHIRQDLKQTLVDLKLDYLDSFVIHWPQAAPSTGKSVTLRTTGAYPAIYTENTMFPYDDNGYFCSDLESHYVETWLSMEELIGEGIVKNIGLSNFNKTQINEIMNIKESKYKPATLQNECHPYLQQKDLIDYCSINGIKFQAFSVLGSGNTHLGVTQSPSGTIPLQDKYILELTKKYNKSPAQIILRWQLQRGISFVTKSVNPDRIKDNFNIFDFEIDDNDMKGFDKINYSWRHLLWRETSNHPDYPFKDELPYNYKLEKAPLESSSGTSDN